MGIGIYFFATLFSTGLAFVIRRAIKRALDGWHPADAFSWQNVLRAVFRAFPYAFAFAPYMMMQHGLGLLVPASLVLCGGVIVSAYDLLTQTGLDGMTYFGGTASMFLGVWAGCSFLTFAQQSLSIIQGRSDGTKT